ncbi:MAG TPA: peptidylprolyl isomerase [Bacteriovoracaceae bacterium]|nr:peptidylprolyl isomerase [Bacteriovoracaceae bacterium]
MSIESAGPYRARHILVRHEFEANDLLAKLKRGEEFEKLAQDFSLCPSGKQGGDLGEFPKGRMVPAFEKALLGLKPNEVSGAVRTQFGYHLIKRL